MFFEKLLSKLLKITVIIFLILFNNMACNEHAVHLFPVNNVIHILLTL